MHYDNIIIGCGQAGPPLAHRLAETGQTVALIEKEFFGGVCVNTGCVPTKAYVASARRAWSAKNSAELGVETNEINVSLKKINARKNRFVEDAASSIEKKLREAKNITVYKGAAKFKDNHTILIGNEELKGDRIFINTGARPRQPDNFTKGSYLTNREILELTHIPGHLIVVGGSYIGLEFGQLFHRLGSKVTIIEMNDHLISREDEEISVEVARFLQESGIELRLGFECLKGYHEKGKAVIELDCNEDQKITGTHILAAIGRVPNSDNLGLEHTDIVTNDRGYIQVNNRLQTSVDHIYALGDVNGEGAFTHTAYNDYQIVAGNLLDNEDWKVSDRIMTYGLFIDPPLGRVGMTEKAAKKAGHNVKTVTKCMDSISRANHKGETNGVMKIVADADNDQILGAAFLGIGGDELIYSITDLMYTGQPYTKLTHAVHIHPTVGEYLPSLFNDLK